MSRVRWRLSLLAFVATIFSLYPITTLFDSAAWFGTAAAMTGLVTALGIVTRMATRSRPAVVLVQLAVASYAVLAASAMETFTWLLPTWRSLEQANLLALDAIATIQKHAAPAPLTPGVTFCLVLAAGVVAIAVDAAAATWQSPAAAGLPLLTAYLITAANGAEALSLTSFIPPVFVWLAMLHLTARSRAGGWSKAPATDLLETGEEAPGRHALWSLSAAAARLGGLAVVVAVVLPAVIPHFPPRYLTEGLGRSGTSGAAGTVGFNDTLDVSLSLKETDTSPVLRYTTNGTGRVPLRVLATSHFSGGNWLPSSRSGAPLAPLPTSATAKDYTMRVTSNSLRPPALAAPYPVVAVNLDGTRWGVDPVTRDIKVASLPREYEVTYADASPLAADLREAGPATEDVPSEDLALPDSSRELVTRWAGTVTAGASNALDKAVAIQDHLRDTSRYTYSLDLGDPPRDASGRMLEPVRAFYETRRGYCVQFATAMILMARAEGIPARMAIGFLPGVRDGDEYVVRSADAHAWPELYFKGYGWLRFEPTPGQRSGAAPPYAVAGSDSSSPGANRSGATESVTGTATTTARRLDAQDLQHDTGVGSSSAAGTDRLVSLRTAVTVVAILVALLALVLMPLTARIAALRRRRRARDEREMIEADWEEFISELGDLGLPAPQGGTLRQWREHFIREGHLDTGSAEALGRVTATLERARYDRPERTSPAQVAGVRREVRMLRRSISRSRAWQTRLRSWLWPSAGVEAWRGFRRRRGGDDENSPRPLR